MTTRNAYNDRIKFLARRRVTARVLLLDWPGFRLPGKVA